MLSNNLFIQPMSSFCQSTVCFNVFSTRPVTTGLDWFLLFLPVPVPVQFFNFFETRSHNMSQKKIMFDSCRNQTIGKKSKEQPLWTQSLKI